VTSLKEFDTSTYPIFDRQNMLVSLYDEMIDSILHIIDRLDLSVDKEKTEVNYSGFGFRVVEKDI
jgi:hypothetical protein